MTKKICFYKEHPLHIFYSISLFDLGFFLHVDVFTGWLKYPISQSVCGESVWSSSHSGNDASGLPQSQVVHLCKCWNRISLKGFKAHLKWLHVSKVFLLVFLFLSVSLHHFLILSSCILFFSSETTTYPWWLGSAAPVSQFVGWIVHRTNLCSVFARLPQGHAQRWAVITCSTLVIWAPSAAIYSCNRIFASFTQCWELRLISLSSQISTDWINI